MNDQILTVDQAAALLNLHPKTVRQYIRAGQLKARKVGKQWRILQQDLDAFTGSTDTPTDNGINLVPGDPAHSLPGPEPKIQVSAVVDIRVKNREEALRLSNSVVAVLNCKDPAYGRARCDFFYYETEHKARFVLWGGARFIGELLQLLSKITD